MNIVSRSEARRLGLTRYFTGKPCKHGHTSERLVSNLHCVECKSYHKRQHYAKNSKKVSEYNKLHYIKNADKYREYQRQYRIDNADRLRKSSREFTRKWRIQNPEYQCQYQANNREKFHANVAKRRAAKLNRTLSHNKELTQFVMQEALQQSKDMEELFGVSFHVDHMIPMQALKVSGFHVWYNLQVLPASLNIGKGNRMLYTEPFEWLSDFTYKNNEELCTEPLTTNA